eukprot:gnl/MRDRNA2_/MRDRNA2_17658_c0_seq1.p1 gnl/MRDRNA2_/MRDRNA2_17658_c0~~gnl/MRDRNA2_/MRDRNA2_17658_c0_seq1.p1  ORF type:complete len:283 (+),score=51.65 gnl/MRDRNA2_/MRDRNA2_17658_c0_seq1:97-945(+)
MGTFSALSGRTNVICAAMSGAVGILIPILLLSTEKGKKFSKSLLSRLLSSEFSTSRATSMSGSCIPDADSTFALIKNRRSVFPKDYTGEKVPDVVVSRLLESATWAPTHGKTEPWRFVVFSSKQAITNLFELFREHAEATMNEDQYQNFVDKQNKKKKDRDKVSHLIGIVMKRQPLEEKLMPEWEEQSAVACAVQNMYLQATSTEIDAENGVGVYWSSSGVKEAAVSKASDKVREAFGLPPSAEDNGDRCMGLFFVGVCPKKKIASYRSKRGDISEKVKWVS